MIFLLTLGSVHSQVLFHFSISRNYKWSYSDILFNGTNTSENLTFPDFTIYQSEKTFDQPKRIAFNLGLSIKRHQFHLGIQSDGVSSKYSIYFTSYDNVLNTYRPNSLSGTGKTPQSRASLNYDFYLLKKERKTNLYITTSLGLCFRAGPRGVGSVGTLGSSGNLSTTKILQLVSASFTDVPKYVFNFGGGLGTDIFYKKYYLLTLTAGFTYSKRNLYFTENTINVIDNSSSEKYVFKTVDNCSSIYFGISRRFQIFPWKPIKNTPIWKELHPLNTDKYKENKKFIINT